MQPQSGNEELNGLGYNSSAPDFAAIAPKAEVSDKDVADFSTLQRVASVLSSRKAFYNSNNAIVYGETLTVENQHIINHQHTLLIQELESLIIGAIKNVEEINRERRQ